jgi:hypothetical protein
MAALSAAFDRAYEVLVQLGGENSDPGYAGRVFPGPALAEVQRTAADLLGAPAVELIRGFPMHGAACLALARDLRTAGPGRALDRMLDYHHAVQKDRSRGTGWIRQEEGRQLLLVTTYAPRPDRPRFPSLKLDVVRMLLQDTGRLPFSAAEPMAEDAL